MMRAPGQRRSPKDGTTPSLVCSMLVKMRNPKRDVEMPGNRTVNRLLDDLDLVRESHLVICNGTLVPGDARLADEDVVEIRPVISGGSE